MFALKVRNAARIWERARGRPEKRTRSPYSETPCVLCGAALVPKWRAVEIRVSM